MWWLLILHVANIPLKSSFNAKYSSSAALWRGKLKLSGTQSTRKGVAWEALWIRGSCNWKSSWKISATLWQVLHFSYPHNQEECYLIIYSTYQGCGNCKREVWVTLKRGKVWQGKGMGRFSKLYFQLLWDFHDISTFWGFSCKPHSFQSVAC